MASEVRAERLRGHFWLLGAETRKVPGELTLGPGSPELVTDAMLTPSVKVMESVTAPDGSTSRGVVPATGEDEPLTVHGEIEFCVGARRVTLVDCMTTGRNYSMSVASRPLEGRHTLRARYAVRGDHIAGKDERFTAIRVRLRHLDEWASLPGFAYAHGGGGDHSVRFERTHVPPVPLHDCGSLDIEQPVTVDIPSAVGGSLTRTVWLRAAQLRPTSWTDLDRTLVTPLSTLLTLATGHDCPPVEVEIDNGSGSGWLSVHSSGLGEPAAHSLNAWTMLLPLDTLGLARVAAWLARVEALGPLPPVVAAATVGELGRIETSVLELTTVAEGLARRLWPDAVRMTRDEATQAQGLAVASVVEQPDEVVKAVGTALTYLQEVGYPQRLLQLAKCAEAVVPGVVGRRTTEGHPSRWKKLVCSARNEFAHRLYGGWLDADRIDQYLTVTGSLQWLLTAVLLLETGVPAGSLAEQFGQHQPYLSFLREAQAWVPRVYTPAEETSA